MFNFIKSLEKFLLVSLQTTLSVSCKIHNVNLYVVKKKERKMFKHVFQNLDKTDFFFLLVTISQDGEKSSKESQRI